MNSGKIIFNTVSEVGLRMMLLLNILKPEKIDLDRINYFDYLMLYMNDEKIQINSLHPEYPMMLIELFTKKELLKESLLYVGSKSLISIECSHKGISYSANSNTEWFLDCLMDDKYAKELIKRAEVIKDKFNFYQNSELKILIENMIKNKEKNFENLFPYEDGGI
ncbi:ABC-three component system middle component 2 [Clostridium butyricum]|uniref:Uncharacterized protein n=1 Tax=Clostridium butyricum E4 str. BoNT E BL5262 TaxID=632245 RepID=C4IE38_CLOBU|nr:ABC-three component system middle component 2 [Clostridium butyricum]EDT73871.1 putative threonine efflux protein [Clostridium butyricum 5521]EEP55109.1 conserved hypothetical protein [Clostridium butyricum E4 str. BoNT E BL5262]NFL31984.1 threonine transporter [Clostridium butyricum]NFS18758.1 threonine transporter [Clostridium butyricum]